MDDDEFRNRVLQELAVLSTNQIALGEQVSEFSSRVDTRLDAIVSRLDEQDIAHERLMQKVDRLSHHVSLASQASEQALDSLTFLSRRVARIEHPDGDPPAREA
ncbi:MAG: hypothetical protein AAFV87_18920 [Pseudomonadota bacterium]